jgi:quercetin dioxygenase-like cupin family protein
MSSTARSAGVVTAGEGRSFTVLGHTANVKVSSADTPGGAYTFELVTPAGLPGPPPHVHENEDELITVISGEFDVLIGGHVTRAKAGDVMNFARGTAHTFTHVGNEPGVTLWTVTPGASFEAFFEELGALPAGPPDPAVLVPLFARYGMTILAP